MLNRFSQKVESKIEIPARCASVDVAIFGKYKPEAQASERFTASPEVHSLALRARIVCGENALVANEGATSKHDSERFRFLRFALGGSTCSRFVLVLKPFLVSLVAFVMAGQCCVATGWGKQTESPQPQSTQQYSVLEQDSDTPVQIKPITQSPDQPPQSVDAGAEIDDVLTKIVLANMPREFEETKDWGGQDERWDGIKFHREGWRIDTNRRKKMVNDGTWKKYKASLRNPEEEFSLQIKNMHETVDGKLMLETHVAAHLDITARQSKWLKGVQLYSVSANGHAKIRLQVDIEMEVKMGLSNFPPDVILIPKATRAEIVIDEFRIDRFSKIGGEVAQKISKSVQAQLEKKIDAKEEKLVAKINKQLDKKKDDFRLSIAEAMKSKWSKPLQGILSKSGQQ